MMRGFGPAILVLAIVSSIALPCPAYISSTAEGATDPIEQTMSGMTPAQRVGQLFLVAFPGKDVGRNSDVAQLIREYGVGGLVLSPRNGNFANESGGPYQVVSLARELQKLALESRPSRPAASGATSTPSPVPGPSSAVPLFLAVEHEGDGYPYTAIREGMTPVPSNMAIGATWSVEDAGKVGEIAGRELSVLGINMLLGPSLDVLTTPRPASAGDLATRSLGGDPFWVGRLGQAYIAGVHRGSQNRVATVAKHFPGLGEADRRPDEEVPTVPKSLSELRNVELLPFLAAVQGAGAADRTDALLSGHIRYRGFQGNIRQLTRPISLDPQNLQTLLSEPGFSAWRSRGGLVVSDGLGVPAVRRYYDPQLKTFPFKRIAQDALLAGNDLLVLRDFGLTDDWTEQFDDIRETIEFFQEKYESDPNFHARVDESVRRILALKFRLYGQFEGSQVLPDLSAVVTLNKGRADVLEISRHAITLVYPAPDELDDRLQAPPSPSDSILIVTDSRDYAECTRCSRRPMLAADALQRVMVQLYGPRGSGQVDPGKVHSLSFLQLKQFLQADDPDKSEPLKRVAAMLEEANWIIFAQLDAKTDQAPDADAVKAFLKLRPDSLRGKKIVVFAFGAPYYLDTTEISKLTAYFAVYSRVEPFVEAAARALFGEFVPAGALPVTVEGINYNLIANTSPDPRQIIPVQLAGDPGEPPAQALDVKVGSTLYLRTGTILDRNGHMVPDGTPVSFRLVYPAEALELPRREVTSRGGVAETSITLERMGQLEINVSSDPALQSTTLIVTIQGEQPAIIATLVPLIATEAVTNGASVQAKVVAPDPAAALPVRLRPRVIPADLWLTLIGMLSLNLAADLLRWRRGWTRVVRLRLWLLGIVCGLVGYLVYATGFMGTGPLWRIYGHLGSVLFGIGFSLIPLVTALIVRGIRAAQ